MKRKMAIVALVVLLATITVLPLSALAEKHPFSISAVQCYSEGAPLKYYLTEIWKYNSYEKVFVEHSAVGTTNSYTNLFHATRSASTGQTGILSGNKWCTPNLYVPIQSNAIYQDYYYGLAARGNTKYNQYESLSQFNVTGSYDPNLN